MKFQRMLQTYRDPLMVLAGVMILLAGLSHLFAQELAALLLLAAASIIGFVPIALHAYQALRVKTISIELLVSIAVLGAFMIGEFEESAIVTFLFVFGSYLERKTLEKTRSSIQSLTAMAPATALQETATGVTEIDIDEVAVGDVLLVKTGAQVPVDGVILTGSGYLNEASVTGESQEVKKTTEDHVYAGTYLENGTLRIEAERVGEDTTFGKIIELVEEAQDTKSPAEKFIDKFARYYTPAVLLLSLVVGLISRDIRLAITILVLGCPGALVIGAPVSSVAGIGNGAKNGVLMKGGDVMSAFSQVDTLLFDKTGTLTKGQTEVVAQEVISADTTVLAIVAAAEGESDHPLARAISSYLTTEPVMIEETTVLKGQGLQVKALGKTVYIGNEKLLTEAGLSLTAVRPLLTKLQQKGVSTVLVGDEQVRYLFGIADQVRPDVKENLQTLRAAGIQHMAMLTGDNRQTAEAIAGQLGIDEVYAELLPEEKAAIVAELGKQGRQTAFIGDGVNDSPSLALADIGIAMGSGTDVAIETSDVVLMRSSFSELVHAFRLAKKTMSNLRQNIAIAIATVVFLLIGLLAGYIYMASGMFVHEASILVVILNGMRLLKFQTKPVKIDTDQVLMREDSLK
ncbi:HAD family hydrolase [Enterococcus canis]|uniref:Cd(2+)-exporting ATPase n=1 Tax=Enterococcus canis TaxID=214095 RepID=A0A1L8RE43_9ENTE|nr:heavy metal translocating P-type ATPase [Enterococcus canis]OJG18004.1 HAD family hydrolase [Enterococcus canis]